MIHVTKTFMPPIEEYEAYLEKIWASGHVTNKGPLLLEFEEQVRNKLGIDDFQFVANGTLALQIALRAFDITEGEVITTPFSYVATTSAILWERCTPVFVDIDPDTFCIDPEKIESAITDKTKAILPVHVYGHPCDVEKIQAIAEKHNIKVIHDAAHAFGVTYQGKSLLAYGDAAVCSFHATKPFHTIEGGGLVFKDKEISQKADLLKRFGHNNDDHYRLGINTKASDFQAAMGLCNLRYIDEITEKRKKITELYDRLLGRTQKRQKQNHPLEYNYAYYPLLFETENKLLNSLEVLGQLDIFPRRYFYPSLNTLPYLSSTQSCPVSEDIARRIVCLPLYSDLAEAAVHKICEIINQ